MATIKVTPQPCGQHILIEITHNTHVRSIMMTKERLKEVSTNIDKDFELLLKNLITFCRLSGASSWAEIKTLIEAKTFQV